MPAAQRFAASLIVPFLISWAADGRLPSCSDVVPFRMSTDVDRQLTHFVQQLRPQVRGEVSLGVASPGAVDCTAVTHGDDVWAGARTGDSSVGQAAHAASRRADRSVARQPLPQSLPFCRLVPRTTADVSAALAWACERQMPVQFGAHPPVMGSPAAFNMFSRCAQTGWLQIDAGPYLNRVESFDAKRAVIEIEPGLRVEALDRFLRPHGLWLPIESGYGRGATVAGSVAEDAAALNPAWGTMADRLLGVDALLADGTAQLFGPFGANSSITLRSGRAGQMVSALFGIAGAVQMDIQRHWPSGPRQPDGYLLDCFHPRPERAYTPDGSVNLAHLLAGSRGSLAWSARLHLRLLRRPAHHRGVLLVFASVSDALAQLPDILGLQPSAALLLDAADMQQLVHSGMASDRALSRDLIDVLQRVGGRLDAQVYETMAADPAVGVLLRFSGDEDGALQRQLRILAVELGRHWASVDTGVPLPEHGVSARPTVATAGAQRSTSADAASAATLFQRAAAVFPRDAAASATPGPIGSVREAAPDGPVWWRLIDEALGDTFGLEELRAARRHGWKAQPSDMASTTAGRVGSPAGTGALRMAPGRLPQLLARVEALEAACRRVGIHLSWRGQLLSGELCLRPLPGPVSAVRAWGFLEAAVGRLQAGRWSPALQQAFGQVRRQFDPGGILAPALTTGRELRSQ